MNDTFNHRALRGLRGTPLANVPGGGMKVPKAMPMAAPVRPTLRVAFGGLVPGPGTGDSVPAMLEPGEAVLPKETVAAIGPETVHAMIRQSSGAAPKGLSPGGRYSTGLDPTLPPQQPQNNPAGDIGIGMHAANWAGNAVKAAGQTGPSLLDRAATGVSDAAGATMNGLRSAAGVVGDAAGSLRDRVMGAAPAAPAAAPAAPAAAPPAAPVAAAPVPPAAPAAPAGALPLATRLGQAVRPVVESLRGARLPALGVGIEALTSGKKNAFLDDPNTSMGDRLNVLGRDVLTHGGAAVGGLAGAAGGAFVPLPGTTIAGGIGGAMLGHSVGDNIADMADDALGVSRHPELGGQTGVPMQQHVTFSPQAIANRKAAGQWVPGDPEPGTAPAAAAPASPQLGVEQNNNAASEAAWKAYKSGQGANGRLTETANDAGTRGGLNAAYGAAGNGISVGTRRGADGKPQTEYTGTSPTKPQFVDTDGNPTNDYTRTAQYAQGLDTRASYDRTSDAARSLHDYAVSDAASPYAGWGKPTDTSIEGMIGASQRRRNEALSNVRRGQDITANIAAGEQGNVRRGQDVTNLGNQLSYGAQIARMNFERGQAMMERGDKEDDRAATVDNGDGKGTHVDPTLRQAIGKAKGDLAAKSGIQPWQIGAGDNHRIQTQANIIAANNKANGGLLGALQALTGHQQQNLEGLSGLPRGSINFERGPLGQPGYRIGDTWHSADTLHDGGEWGLGAVDKARFDELNHLAQITGGTPHPDYLKQHPGGR
jgi:hypothetical protein